MIVVMGSPEVFEHYLTILVSFSTTPTKRLQQPQHTHRKTSKRKRTVQRTDQRTAERSTQRSAQRSTHRSTQMTTHPSPPRSAHTRPTPTPPHPRSSPNKQLLKTAHQKMGIPQEVDVGCQGMCMTTVESAIFVLRRSCGPKTGVTRWPQIWPSKVQGPL